LPQLAHEMGFSFVISTDFYWRGWWAVAGPGQDSNTAYWVVAEARKGRNRDVCNASWSMNPLPRCHHGGFAEHNFETTMVWKWWEIYPKRRATGNSGLLYGKRLASQYITGHR
jgi:hypothetical protein